MKPTFMHLASLCVLLLVLATPLLAQPPGRDALIESVRRDGPTALPTDFDTLRRVLIKNYGVSAASFDSDCARIGGGQMIDAAKHWVEHGNVDGKYWVALNNWCPVQLGLLNWNPVSVSQGLEALLRDLEPARQEWHTTHTANELLRREEALREPEPEVTIDGKTYGCSDRADVFNKLRSIHHSRNSTAILSWSERDLDSISGLFDGCAKRESSTPTAYELSSVQQHINGIRNLRAIAEQFDRPITTVGGLAFTCFAIRDAFSSRSESPEEFVVGKKVQDYSDSDFSDLKSAYIDCVNQAKNSSNPSVYIRPTATIFYDEAIRQWKQTRADRITRKARETAEKLAKQRLVECVHKREYQRHAAAGMLARSLMFEQGGIGDAFIPIIGGVMVRDEVRHWRGWYERHGGTETEMKDILEEAKTPNPCHELGAPNTLDDASWRPDQ